MVPLFCSSQAEWKAFVQLDVSALIQDFKHSGVSLLLATHEDVYFQNPKL